MHKLPAVEIDRPAHASIKRRMITSNAAAKKSPAGSAGLEFESRTHCVGLWRFGKRQSFAVTLTPRTEGMVFGAPIAAPMIIGNGTGFSGSALIVRLFGASR